MLLGCIGDDFTGSSDLANTLAKGGMRTVQYVGIPAETAADDVEAGVVSLKSRTIPAAEAIAQSLEALEWLQAQGCRQFFFKYCSTFDSSPRGNIGPVAEALLAALGAQRAVVCPAFPATGRSLYQGHLFVNDRLLSESGMQNHPLTPMTDPDIRRWLRLQTEGGVGHIPYPLVARGAEAIGQALAEQKGLVVVDAVDEDDLFRIGKAVAEDRLVTGGSGVALGLPGNFRDMGLVAGRPKAWRGASGAAIVLSGSCSNQTRRQIAAHLDAGHPAVRIHAEALMAGELSVEQIVQWALEAEALPLVYSSAEPDAVRAAQNRFGADTLAETIERFFADLAAALCAAGFARIISAGGETSGAVVAGLGLKAFEIGPEIDPGVPALRAVDADLALALKSGNFGAADFFARAAVVLGSGRPPNAAR